MKLVSGDHNYVDYRAQQVGVRVRKGLCRPIIMERGRWTEYGVSYSIPVELRQLHAQKTGISSLASNVRQVEEFESEDRDSSELRRLLAGEISFEDVVGQPVRKSVESRSRELQAISIGA